MHQEERSEPAASHFVGFFNSLLKLFTKLNVGEKNPTTSLVSLEVATRDPVHIFSLKHY